MAPATPQSPLQPVYLAANPVEAEIVKGYLAAQGIATRVFGGYSWGAAGELPFPEVYPRLYLEQEHLRDRALQLIREYERGSGRGSRACRQCGESSPDTFGICWNCGAAHEP